MPYGRLVADRVRCLVEVDCALGPGFNVWTGLNGAGKTSVLEAVHLLGYGRTLRQRSWRELLAVDADLLTVALERQSGGRVQLRRSPQGLRAQIDGVEVAALELARAVPSVCFHPEAASRWFAEAEVRRRGLDFVLFHADEHFLSHWQRWQRVRRQRQAALQGSDRQSFRALTPAFLQQGLWLDQLRRPMLQRLLAGMQTVLRHWSFADAVALDYWPGWTEDSLEAACARAEVEELRQQRLLVGPQRADVRVRWLGRAAQSMVSRGQQKMVTLAWLLAALIVLRECGREVILLLDDPVAELDRGARELLFEWLRAHEVQVLLTAVEPTPLPLHCGDWRMFHVERGRVSRAA